jgi:hypothetical protein
LSMYFLDTNPKNSKTMDQVHSNIKIVKKKIYIMITW